MIANASVGEARSAEEALAALCSRYWQPVFNYLRQRGYPADFAAETTQGFFLYLIEKRLFEVADPERGRFRSFLLGSLRRFVSDLRSRKNAAKRGGGVADLSLDDLHENGHQVASDAAFFDAADFDRNWAEGLLLNSLERVALEYSKKGKSRAFEVLRAFLPGTGGSEPDYPEVASQLGLSIAATKTAVHRFRREFGAVVREEVGLTVSSAEDVTDELNHLIRILRRVG